MAGIDHHIIPGKALHESGRQHPIGLLGLFVLFPNCLIFLFAAILL
jgi:hypothetical protein